MWLRWFLPNIWLQKQLFALLSLGEHADKIVTFFGNHDNSSPAVLILQFCKTRKYLGI